MKKEIEFLKKQLDEKTSIIDYLFKRINELENNNSFTPYIYRDGGCINGEKHEYQFPWHSTTPPHCKKCGQIAPTYDTYTTNNLNNLA